ncbi:MAG: type II secretion system major pseudopilin GspG [Verrucomicrobiae bacterium]|nr:type II secretion system major pseudopilin GspG [Verrucomicrobiae bacterium]
MKTNQKTRSAQARGYTLMEMLLVLGIIGLLLGLGVYSMVGVLGDADDSKVRADIQNFHANLIRYKTKAGIYPTTEQGLEALVKRPSSGPAPRAWKQFLKESALVDPWSKPYQYRYPGKHNPDSYDIFSFGMDGQEGTEDDIGNW